MKQIRKINSKKIALLAVMLALTIIFSFVPISFGAVTLALMILPTLIISQIEDFKTTFFMGLMLGLVNYIAWFTTKAALVLAPIFQNPVVCIVPRIMIGVAAWGIKTLLSKLLLTAKCTENEAGERTITNKAYLITMEQVITVASTAVGVIVNTFFVGLFTLLFYNNFVLSNGINIDIKYILAWFGFNFLIEVISFSLLVPPIALALRKAKLVPGMKYKETVIEKPQAD